jgi:hypothetical protein
MNKKDDMTELIISPAKDFVLEIAEMGIGKIISDIVAQENVLSEIPIVKLGLIMNTMRNNFQLAFFLRKYSAFIGPINLYRDHAFREADLISIVGNKKNLDKMIERTIIAIDSYKETVIAKILGVVFVKTFKDHVFNIEEYNTILFSLDIMHPYLGLKCLEKYFSYNRRQVSPELDVDRVNTDYSPLSNTGFLVLPTGGSYCGDVGGAIISKLGMKLYENVISDLIIEL